MRRGRGRHRRRAAGGPLRRQPDLTPRLDVRRLVEVLDRHQVQYVIVGGVAARALPISVDGAWLARMEISTWTTNAGQFDVLVDLPDRSGRRLDYDVVASRARVLAQQGITVLVAALDDIIASKEWADRPKDHEALPELRKLHEHGPSEP